MTGQRGRQTRNTSRQTERLRLTDDETGRRQAERERRKQKSNSRRNGNG